MKRLADFRKQVIEGWTVQRIAAVLIVVGLVVFIFGAVTQYCACAGWPNLGGTLNHMIGDFYANVSVDCLSIAFAILVIDRLNERRAEQELKAQLIREMGSPDNGIALRAVEDLRARGWLRDGTLHSAWMPRANLAGAILSDADLQGANLGIANLVDAVISRGKLQGTYLRDAKCHRTRLHRANLENATITNIQFVTMGLLKGATMPDGNRYAGHFNLPGDLEMAILQGKVIPSDPKRMAQWYDVTLEDYLAGQAWANEHLADLRREAGLDPDTGEPLPADAPAPPAPRRNGHKASMVAHRTRQRKA